MSGDGGGWTLAAKVHRWHMGDPYVEPNAWFAAEQDTETLLDLVSYEDRLPGVAAHGEARLGPVVEELSTARFVVIAEDDPMQRAQWFKEVEEDLFSWFSTTPHLATAVCEDPELTLNCTDGTIQSGMVTLLEGMSLADYGYEAPCGPLHMRTDVDPNPDSSAVSSCTLDANNNAWNDDAVDGQWGNGLEIWLRSEPSVCGDGSSPAAKIATTKTPTIPTGAWITVKSLAVASTSRPSRPTRHRACI